MSRVSYTDRQIDAANLLRSVGGDGIPSEVADEIISMIGEAEQKPAEPIAPKEDDMAIKWQILNETDWRKRAALSAMLISRSLDY